MKPETELELAIFLKSLDFTVPQIALVLSLTAFGTDLGSAIYQAIDPKLHKKESE